MISGMALRCFARFSWAIEITQGNSLWQNRINDLLREKNIPTIHDDREASPNVRTPFIIRLLSEQFGRTAKKPMHPNKYFPLCAGFAIFKMFLCRGGCYLSKAFGVHSFVWHNPFWAFTVFFHTRGIPLREADKCVLRLPSTVYAAHDAPNFR